EAPKPYPEVSTSGSKPTVASNAWQVPVDVNANPTQTDYLNFGWQTMVAINWPALSSNSGGSMGQPDTNSTIGATASNGALVPTVWRTYRDLSTVMLANGADPGAKWNQPYMVPSGCASIGNDPVAPGFQPMFIDNSTFQQAPIVKDYVNQATGNPLVDQEKWYTVTDILLDQSEYTYIQQNGYYVGQNQVNTYKKSGKLQPFPKSGQEYPLPTYAQYGALEVKAAWRVLDPVADKAIIPRYYTQWGYFMQQDGKTCQGPTLLGLIGLHILRLTPSTGTTWFWASFEQVDNTSGSPGVSATVAAPNTPNGNCTSQYNQPPPQAKGNIPWGPTNPPDNLCEVTPIPQNVQQVNASWQKQLQGTVWQYYQMVNTLNPCASGASPCYTFPPIYDSSPGHTINLNVFANTGVESYFQSSNCMDCHGSGTGQGAPQPLTGTNQIFTFVLQNAYNPSAAAGATKQRLLTLFRKPPHSRLIVSPKSKDEKYEKEK
ncbi:MAG TPA: hypothetical protein VE133_14660, partial [Candidatus Sulfotelmatobacter sp.]|nr:hypothetical protein [Candidatus Sulfotelmatobacter sp.]